MRISYRTPENRRYFEQKFSGTNLSKDKLQTMYTVELFITGCMLVDPNMPVMEAPSIMAGHDVPVIPGNANLDIVHRLRVLFREMRSKRVWSQMFRMYAQLPTGYCLYQFKDREWQKKDPILFSNRKSWYEDILSAPAKNVAKKYEFASEGTFEYESKQSVDSIKGNIPYIPNPIPLFPHYRVKGNFQLELSDGVYHPSSGMKETAASSEWRNREGQTIRFRPVQNPLDKVFTYKGVQHIIGGLGAGKSTFMVAETVRLAQQGARIGIIEGSVPQVLNRVKELRQLGINATPIIGKTNRAKHRDDYLAAKQHDIYDISDWSLDTNLELAHLSDQCLIRVLANDEDLSTDYPCRNINQPTQATACLCPFASQCGVYQDYAKLIDAQVWITTSASILQSKVPAMIDPYERTIYEAMYDLLDVIFIDEVDAVQKQFDDAFLEEHALFGTSEHFFEKLLVETTLMTAGKYINSEDIIVQQWIDGLHRLHKMIRDGVYRKLLRSPEFAISLRHRLIQLFTESYRISRAFTSNEEATEIFENKLQRFTENPLDHEIYPEVANLFGAESLEDRKVILKRIVVKLGGEEKPRGSYRYPYDWLEFYLYLSNVDYELEILKDLYPFIRTKLRMFSEINVFQSNQRGFIPFLKEAMTGRLTGYMYEVKREGVPGTFKAVHYSGVGRLLLQDWNSAFEHSDSHQGPAIVLMSGTSYAPGSPHYDVDIKPTWLLESNWEPPKIHQQYYPLFESGSGIPISVSGQDEERRSGSLKRMTTLLLHKFENELAEWRKVQTNRRILIIVNSYADVEDVAAVLKMNPVWRERFRQLSRGTDEIDESKFMRSELERFYHEPADILIAPLLAISRGYNILDEEKGSLFGSVFFLVRPYPVPNDMAYTIQLLHARLPSMLNQIEREKIHYLKAVTLIRRESNKLFHRIYRKQDYWSSLTSKERRTIAWFTFVPIWQTIGRMLRKGTSARVFYCDSKFAAQPLNVDGNESMLDYWHNIMNSNESNSAFRSLYGPFIDSIQMMMKEEEDESF
ncbi:pPIWI_RE_Z domain-containing protein [Paenibacillus tianjinensis]|uniref:pPIWI-RE three-gene island domain-containing protein n=1 Tax=Paenibacillus tianjinensis TaxID=2810347 RepID=A0ABX7LE47_9BACL|nr:hypothetical protein [Paenibacillus tianjinensis]QSF46191.1 hypothetical protein JRJ22_06155 [Paenibacillus tianjinensis]